MPGLSIEEGINQVYNGLRHVVILGAGASIASTIRNPERSGRQLPSMDNFIAVLGMQDIVAQIAPEFQADNFEQLYGKLYTANLMEAREMFGTKPITAKCCELIDLNRWPKSFLAIFKNRSSILRYILIRHR